MEGDEGPKYGRPPLGSVLAGVAASVSITVIFYELWPQPIREALVGMGGGLLAMFWGWRGSVLPATASLDEEGVRAQKRGRRGVLLGVLVLTATAIVLWPLRR